MKFASTISKALLLFFAFLANVFGESSLLEKQINNLINQGMKSHKEQDDILRIKSAGKSFSDLIQLLESNIEMSEVQTDLFGKKSTTDIISFAKDRLIELGAIRLQVCKGQEITFKAKAKTIQDKTVVGKTKSLPCSKLADITDWKGERVSALKYCENGLLRKIKHYGPGRRSASLDTASLNKKELEEVGADLSLFCFERTRVRVKNEYPDLFRY